MHEQHGRPVGPGLAAFGVSGTLADPVLSIFNAQNATVASNDNWGNASNAAAIQPARRE